MSRETELPGLKNDIVSIQEFLFSTPLYSPHRLQKDAGYALMTAELRVDGHCCECGKSSTFLRTTEVGILDLERALARTPALSITLVCARNKDHAIRFIVRLEKSVIEKIGQHPSLADIANDESRTFRAVLSSVDGRELHRAIGLAAHGVGVGSFVYLRRVLERLIARRFSEVKGNNGWSDEDFARKRTAEKIEFLRDYLPDFLVDTKNIYPILSKGIHELDEKECISIFEVLKHAIFFILEEDRQNKEKSDRREKAKRAIANYAGASSTTADKDQD